MKLRTTKAILKRGQWGNRQWPAAQRDIARYYAIHPEVLRRKVERPQSVRFWGSDYQITPRLVSETLGDGRQLIHFTPLNTRPWWYVARVDSRWRLDGDEWYDDGLERLYEAIADEFGVTDFYCEICGLSESNLSDCPCQSERWFPMLSDSSGSCWGQIDWPA